MHRVRALRGVSPLQIILVAIAAGVPLLLFGSNWLFSREFEESRMVREATSQAYEMRYRLQHLLKLHLDLETAERGFIISQRREFLAPYREADQQIEQEFDELTRMADPAYLAPDALRALRTESLQKRRFTAAMIGMTSDGRQEEARRGVASGEGKAIMDRIRRLVGQIDAVQEAHLNAQLDEAEQDRRRLNRTITILHTAVLLLLLLAALIGMRINTARSRALKEMKASNARQTAIFDSAEDGLLMLDAAGRIQSLNPAVAGMFGYDHAELLGEPVGVLFQEAPTPERTAAFLRALDPSRGHMRQYREIEGKTKGGINFPVEVALSPVNVAVERSYLAVIRDITQRKQVEQMKSEFVSIVSHELRTPLTSIAGSLGLLAGGAAGELPERARKLIGIAQSNSARLVRLINDILDIEKIEAGKMDFQVKPVPLGPLLDQCAQANAGFAAGFNVSIMVGPVADDVAVMADEDRLTQVITNLLSNAIKFSPPQDAVRLSVTPGAATHRISVWGNGPGIPEHFRSRIFNKFAQADSSDTRQKGGTGLGLSIVAEIVTRLGGEVSFDSEPGQGATFHVDLPAARQP